MNDRQTDANVWVEGLDDTTGDGPGNYPIDTMLVRQESRTVHDAIRRIKDETFVMNPDFQRDFIWGEDKQSKLIESVLMRMPLPVFYLAENNDAKIVVVDGLQRLSTFKKFLDNELALDLPKRKDLHGKKFDDLTTKLQNRIEDCNLIMYILDEKLPARVRLDMFERVNGGTPLSRQQMRNCLYTGRATKFLKEEANSEIFHRVTGGGLRNHAEMRDREFVNRFCAFYIVPLDQYVGDMDEFLASALVQMNKFSPEEMLDLSRKFRTSLANNFNVFEKHAFRKHSSRDSKRTLLNVSIWDVMTVGLARYSEKKVACKVEPLRLAFYRILEDDDFQRAITSGTNSVARVKRRFEISQNMLTEVLSAHQEN